MNGHPQYAEALALYAMGALDNAQDLAELETHLGTCGECRRELEALRADAALLAFSAVGPTPPDRVRQQLLKAIAAEPRMERRQQKPFVVGRMRSRWLSFAPVAVMLTLVAFSMLLWLDLRSKTRDLRIARRQIAQVQEELNKANIDLLEARKISDVLHAPDAWPVSLVPVMTPAQPQMKVIYSRKKGALFLLANNTHPLPQDKIYELWLLPADGSAPMACGWFKPDNQGNGMMYHELQSVDISAKGFAVTIEPEGGSDKPTPPIVMAPPSG